MSQNQQKDSVFYEKEVAGRNRTIIRTSIIGIIANIFLAAFKAVIGILSNSIAVVLDAVNNLSDALSSVITIIGTKLAGKKPDRKHPLGYGRIEYLSAMIVSAIVLYAGITSFTESVKKIIHPEAADYSMISLIIIASAVVVKLILGRYVKSQGEKVNSGSLIASGSDATFDAILSASVLASAVIFLLTGVSLEAWVGAVIAIIIIKSGIEMMIDTLNDILGKRADAEMTKKIKRLVSKESGVRGAYDLILNDYGPERTYGSVHIEIPENMTAAELDVLIRKITAHVYRETGVIMTGIGIYAYNTQSGESAKIRDAIYKKVLAHDWALQVHGFYIDMENKELRFDVVFSFDIDIHEGLGIVTKEVREMYPDYDVLVTPDVDITDL